MLLENFLRKRLTLLSGKRRSRVRRLKNSLSLKVPERRFPEKREKKLLTGMRDERKSLPRRMKQRGFKKPSQKVF